MFEIIADGCAFVNEIMEEQELLSVTVIVYTLAANPVTVEVVCPVFHTIEYGGWHPKRRIS
jgi:hypothetical protein